MKAVLRRIRISPKKANLIAGMVRRKKVTEALDILRFTPKKGAKILYKVVHSAAYNAKNNFKQSLEDLVITKILVTKGPTYKRILPVSRGRAYPILKRTSHITVEVGLPDDEGIVKDKAEINSNKKEKASIVSPTPAESPKKTAKKPVAKKSVNTADAKEGSKNQVKPKTKSKKEFSEK